MNNASLLALLALALLADAPAHAQQAFPATLVGHAALPAKSFIEAPKDAPASLRTSVKYTGPEGRRDDRIGSIAGSSYLSARGAAEPTGISLPFEGQPVQGFSGIKAMKDGSYWVLSDHGYGSKSNSGDAMLMLHHVKPDWKNGTVERRQTVFLHDPDRQVPFLIVNEATAQRYPTHAVLDIESIQFVGDHDMIDADTGLIIERDNGKGLADTACNGPARPDRQNVPAKLERAYKVILKDADADGFVRKIGYIDLLDVRDPTGVARVGGKDGNFTFPFVTIEDVDIVDAQHIVVANDNNLPYSSGRQLGRNDDNEFILLHVPEPLSAR